MRVATGRSASAVLLLLLPELAGCAGDAPTARPRDPEARRAEERALEFLAREVPRWSRENRCFSCHNNGDAARALYAAIEQSRPVPPPAVADTTEWLSRPGRWDDNRGDPAVSDRCLARIQFLAALVAARDAGLVRRPGALAEAARLVVECQEQDGSWRIEAGRAIGSPATYGDFLATYMAGENLARTGANLAREPVARAREWLAGAPIGSVLDAAVALLALGDGETPAARERRQECLAIIRRGQAEDGGWGPHVMSPPEPFDTALVLLALEGLRDHPSLENELSARIRRGRAFLHATQDADGGWPETTRPPGAESYAQRLSTSGWATLALLETTD